MTRYAPRRLALAATLLPLALGLGGCGKDDKSADTAGSPTGTPVTSVAPPQGQAWSGVVAKTPEGGYRMGNPNAAIKLVEYGSLTCPHCAEFAKESGDELRTGFVDSGRVSFEFRNFVRDPIDLTAALLTHCGAPETFFALTHEVFANQQSIFEKVQGPGSEAALAKAAALPGNQRFLALAQLTGLTDLFAARGVPRSQAETCLANTATAEALAKATNEQGKEFGVEGTPTFLINGQKGETVGWKELKARLQAAGAR
ncbi:MAG: thioredoxin domain-containing protein [Novosphingobium sp.]